MTEEKNIISAYLQTQKERGTHYADVTFLAAVFSTLVLTYESDEQVTKQLKEMNFESAFSKKAINDALAVTELLQSNGNITIFEAADMYFAEKGGGK